MLLSLFITKRENLQELKLALIFIVALSTSITSLLFLSEDISKYLHTRFPFPDNMSIQEINSNIQKYIKVYALPYVFTTVWGLYIIAKRERVITTENQSDLDKLMTLKKFSLKIGHKLFRLITGS